jgi:hypothetical protein
LTSNINLVVWNTSTGDLVHNFRLDRGPIVSLQTDERTIVVACKGDCVNNRITVLNFGNSTKTLSQSEDEHDAEDDNAQVNVTKIDDERAQNGFDMVKGFEDKEHIIDAHPASTFPVGGTDDKSQYSKSFDDEDEEDRKLQREIDDVLASCLDAGVDVELTEYLACTEGNTSDFDEDGGVELDEDDQYLSDEEDIWEDAGQVEVLEGFA